jgi:ATP-dependent Lon protease
MEVDFRDTSQIEIPKNPFDHIIGQEQAVHIAKLIPRQRRHLLLVGPPGTGKSMIAQAIASLMPKPEYEISVVDNAEHPERPFVETRNENQLGEQNNEKKKFGQLVTALDVPSFVAERLGFRCRRCAANSSYTEMICPQCGAQKNARGGFLDRQAMLGSDASGNPRVATSRKYANGKEEIFIYERTKEGDILMLSQDEMRKLDEAAKKSRRKVLVPIKRPLFVQASGGSETELLGDIRHDPYGSHPGLGTPAYLRVVPGAVHDSHEGVLFIDELSTLGEIQRYILTAMQDKQYPIVGRNPMSSGAAVRVDSVPCDFLFVGASNINDVKNIIPPLRSRIRGDGYEILMNSHMEDTPANRGKLYQFMAQEIVKDGKIPHAEREAAEMLVTEASKLAKEIDSANGLTLRLRTLAGITKMAGDIASVEEKELIDKGDIKQAIVNSKPIEEQLRDKYGSWWATEAADHGIKGIKAGPETA